MYKVFFNASVLTIDSEIKTSPKNNNTKNTEYQQIKSTPSLIAEIEQSKKPLNLTFVTQNASQLWGLFRKQFIEIPAAGGIVKNKNEQLLFIKRLGKWDLPKGKIENNESIETAAVREVEEECGINGVQLLQKLDSTFHIYRSPYHEIPNNLVLKETHWFEMFYDGDEIPVPQIKENIEEVRWFQKNELQTVFENTYGNIEELIKSYLAK